MPQMHAIMKNWHPMFGFDWHCPWVPGTPSPAPAPVMYKTGAMLKWMTELKDLTKVAWSHSSQGWGYSMKQGTDIGPLIPHIGPPSLLIPIEIIFSSSKSYFFTSQYKAEGENICVALAILVNPNLDCGTPMPTPTGVVLALNTHFAGMSWAEFIQALNQMALEALIQTILNFLCGKLGDTILGRMTAAPRCPAHRCGAGALTRGAERGSHARTGGCDRQL